MIHPAPHALWAPPTLEITPARAAFATLDRSEQQLLAAVLFDGLRCTQIARAMGVPASDIRLCVSEAMYALHAELTAPYCDCADDGAGDGGGAVDSMLALRALDALDPDETELVDALLVHQPALQRLYVEHCAVVGELCMMVLEASPAPGTWQRLQAATEDELAIN
jgi:hypothetical protein